MMSRLALGMVAAVGLYIGTFGLPMSGPCVGVAGAAPSPTCSSDLRECLRLSAKTGIYGARYVTAEDVAKCVEAFNACIHGGASTGGNTAPPPTTSPGGGRKGLPQHFAIDDTSGIVGDCRLNGDAMSCTQSWGSPPDWVQTWSGTVTGTLSGLTMTGNQKVHVLGDAGQGCTLEENYSGSVTYVFSLDGTVKITAGPVHRESTFSCAEPTSGTSEGGESQGTWSPIN